MYVAEAAWESEGKPVGNCCPKRSRPPYTEVTMDSYVPYQDSMATTSSTAESTGVVALTSTTTGANALDRALNEINPCCCALEEHLWPIRGALNYTHLGNLTPWVKGAA